MVDTNFVVTCYDGTLASFDPSTGAIPPFNGGPTNSGTALTTYFPPTNPNFGILGFPLFVYVGDDSSLVKSETYLASSSAVSSGTISPTDALAVTFAFKPSGDVLGVKGRNEVSTVTGLEKDMSAALDSGASTYTIYSGCYSTTSSRIIVNRRITGFARDTSGATIAYNVTDGADCGGNFVDVVAGQSHQRAKSCSSSTVSSFWLRTK